jgi:hypothetical protein
MENASSTIFEAVTNRLREIARPLPKSFEISYDLGIYGDVLFLDLLL